MVKNKVILTGLLFGGLIGMQAQASNYVDNAKIATAFFAGASVVRNSAECLMKTRTDSGCPVAGRSVDSSSDIITRKLRIGSYSVGFRTANNVETKIGTLKSIRPVVDGFTLKNVAKDVAVATAAWYVVQKGYVKVPSFSEFTRK